MPSDDINLVPSEVQTNKKRASRKRFLLVVSTVQLVAVVSFSVSVVLFSLGLDRSILNTQQKTEQKKALIRSQVQTELLVRRIEAKSKAVTTLLSERQFYSKLLKALPGILPMGTSIQALTVSGGEVDINATALSTIDVAKFLRVSVDENRGGLLFSKAELASVGIEKSTGKSKFSVTLTLREGVLGK